MNAEYHSKSGTTFYGFSASGSSDGGGDPYVDGQLEKALAELDREKRLAIAADLQRYLAPKQYDLKWPGGASGFKLAWPVLRNFNVFRGSTNNVRDQYYWWLDDSQAPLKRS